MKTDSKQCRKCLGVFQLENFVKAKRCIGGRANTCKGCKSIEDKAFQANYKPDKAHRARLQRIRTKGHDGYQLNKRVLGSNKSKCSFCGITKPNSEFGKNKHLTNGISIYCLGCANRKSQLFLSNPENKARCQARGRARALKRRSTPEGRLHGRMSTAIRRGLGKMKNGRTWSSLVGYSPEELRLYIESKFTHGMTWELLLQGKIHIDHIKPQSLFKYTCPNDIDFKECWGLYNLQPLWSTENLKKSNKYAEF